LRAAAAAQTADGGAVRRLADLFSALDEMLDEIRQSGGRNASPPTIDRGLPRRRRRQRRRNEED